VVWVGLGGERASAPISKGSVCDLRRLVLRTLNEKQILILTNVARQRRTMTSLLRSLSTEFDIPLSTLKLNARILRELNLISYGWAEGVKEAELRDLGAFILSLLRGDPEAAVIQFSS